MNTKSFTDNDHISRVESSRYNELLQFTIEKALENEEFTVDEVKQFFPGSSDKEVSRRLANLCHSRIENFERFQVKPEAFLAYLEFLSIQDSQTTSHKADRRAVTAIWIAIAGLALNLLVGLASLVLSFGPTPLDGDQLETLDVTQELRSIETALNDSKSTGSSERSEITRHLMSSRRIDESQVQEVVEAINRPSKLDEAQWKELQALIRQLSEKKTEPGPNNSSPKTNK